MKQNFGKLVILVVMAMVLVGCGENASTPTSMPTSTVATTQAAVVKEGKATDISDQQQPHVISGCCTHVLAWSPDGKILASGFWADGTIRLWSADGKTQTALSGHDGSVYSLAWSPDGKILASGSSDQTVRLWSSDGKPELELEGHDGPVYAVAWSPDGKTLASASADKATRLWGKVNACY